MIKFICAAMVFVAAAASAEIIPGFGGAKNQPITISSEELAIDQLAKQALFSGKVKLSQADIVITALRMSVIYEQGDKGIEPKFLYALGDVVLTGVSKAGQPAPQAQGELAEYNIKTKKLILTGKVRLTRAKQVFKGQSLTVDVVSGLSQLDSVKGGKDGRIRGIFQRGKK